jgi:hypothetical protein
MDGEGWRRRAVVVGSRQAHTRGHNALGTHAGQEACQRGGNHVVSVGMHAGRGGAPAAG